MEEKKLTSIALVCSIIGILLLLVITESQSVASATIAKITNQSVDQTVSINGKITQLSATPAITIAQVQDSSGVIKIIIFPKEAIDLRKGDKVSVEGVVKEFENKLELEAKLIKVI